MENAASSLDLLLDIEARHEDLLVRLDELDKRIETVLAQYQSLRSRPERAAAPAKNG